MGKTLEQMDLNFDDPTLEETERQQRMAEGIEFSQAYGPEIGRSLRRTRITHPERYDTLLEYHNFHKVNIESPEDKDIILMRRGIINIIGYIKLIGKGGEKVLTIDAKPSRILEAYRDFIIRAESIQQ